MCVRKLVHVEVYIYTPFLLSSCIHYSTQRSACSISFGCQNFCKNSKNENFSWPVSFYTPYAVNVVFSDCIALLMPDSSFVWFLCSGDLIIEFIGANCHYIAQLEESLVFTNDGSGTQVNKQKRHFI